MLEEWSYNSPPIPYAPFTKDDWDLCLMNTSKLQRMLIIKIHEAPSSNLQLFLKVLMMTILILKLHMNNDPSSGVPLSKPDFENSRSSWIVVPSKVHSIDQPQGYQGKCRLRFWKKNVK